MFLVILSDAGAISTSAEFLLIKNIITNISVHVFSCHFELVACHNYEVRQEKTRFCLWDSKGADQLSSKCTADQPLVFTTQIEQFLFL